MKLVSQEGRIYRMSVARLRAYMTMLAAGKDPRLADYGQDLGQAQNVTDYTADDARAYLDEQKR